MINIDQVVVARAHEQAMAETYIPRRPTCACCGAPLRHPAGKGRPRIICGARACVNERHQQARRLVARQAAASLGTEHAHDARPTQSPGRRAPFTPNVRSP